MIVGKKFLTSFIGLIICAIITTSTCQAQEKAPVPPTANEIFEHSKVLYNTNNKQEALKALLTIPVGFQNEETNLLISNIYAEMGELDKAINYLKKAIVENKNYYRAYYNLGLIYQKKKDNFTAIENYKLAISKNREFPYAYYNLGCLYASLNDFRHAKSNFVKAIAYKNDDKDFYYNLAYTYKQLGDEKNAKKILAVYDKLSEH